MLSLAALLPSLLIAPALAQTTPQPDADAQAASSQLEQPATESPTWQDAKLRLRVEPSIWYMGVGGELKLPSPTLAGQGESIEVDELGFDSPEIVPHIEAHIFAGEKWRFGLRGFVFSDDQTTLMSRTGRIGDINFDNASTIRSGLDYASFEFEAAYQVYRYDSPNTTADGRRRITSRLEALAGLRLIDIDWQVDRISAGGGVSGGSASGGVDETYIEIMAGGKFAFAFNEEWGVDVTIALGTSPFGDATSFSGDIIVGGTYEPTWAPNFGLQIGYRSAFFNLSSGDGDQEFEYSGAHQGLMLGVVLKF